VLNRRELLVAPPLYLPPHRLKVPLHAVDANGQAVLQGKVLRVLGQYRGKGSKSRPFTPAATAQQQMLAASVASFPVPSFPVLLFLDALTCREVS
jgi:hypothetical protein